MARAGSLPGPHLETQSFFIAFLSGLFSNKKREASAFLHYRMESSRIASPSIFLMVNTPSS